CVALLSPPEVTEFSPLRVEWHRPFRIIVGRAMVFQTPGFRRSFTFEPARHAPAPAPRIEALRWSMSAARDYAELSEDAEERSMMNPTSASTLHAPLCDATVRELLIELARLEERMLADGGGDPDGYERLITRREDAILAEL